MQPWSLVEIYAECVNVLWETLSRRQITTLTRKDPKEIDYWKKGGVFHSFFEGGEKKKTASSGPVRIMPLYIRKSQTAS